MDRKRRSADRNRKDSSQKERYSLIRLPHMPPAGRFLKEVFAHETGSDRSCALHRQQAGMRRRYRTGRWRYGLLKADG